MTDEIGGGASRSTEPAAGTSQATDVSLREYLTALINAAEKRSDARFDAMKEMVETAFKTAQEAITKAEAATDRRLEGMNEFRDSLSDQATRFVTKDALDSLVAKLESEIDRNREDLDSLAKRIDIRQGQLEGSKITTTTLVTVITVSIAVLGLIIVLANYFTLHG